jgi:hypothetical protein
MLHKSDIIPMPQFFDRYINLVEDIHIFEAFDTYTPEGIYSDISKLSALGDRVYEPGKWTVKDILQHVIDNERIMSYRALRFSRNDTTVLPGYDEQWLAKNTNASNRTLESLLTEFNQVRMSTVALFKGMSEEMMMRSGRAYTSEISALALGFVIVGHAIHHMNVLEQRYFTML